MADEPHELRQVSWNEVFSFTQIFKCFKMAIHPSKLILAVVALVLVFVAGKALDGFWGLGNSYVMPGEIANHVQMPSEQFDKTIQDWQDSRLDDAITLFARWQRQGRSFDVVRGRLGPTLGPIFSEELEKKDRKEPSLLDREKIKEKSTWSEVLDDAEDAFDDTMADAGKLLEPTWKLARERVEDTGDDEAQEKLDKEIAHSKQAMTRLRQEFQREVESIRGRGIFTSLRDYEAACIRNAIYAVRYGNILGGLKKYRAMIQPPAATISPSPIPWTEPSATNDSEGFVFYVLMCAHGVVWLASEHWVFALIFLVFSLAVWALFGGAIHRIAALHAAREEKISMGQALRFAAAKFLSFFMAPLIPLGVIVIIGLLLLLGGLIANIPGVGALLIGLLFFLAILGGLAIAFLLLGLVGGEALMYPTIAVEGSDSFDAISRSYSYIFNRPWRSGLYALIALAYGTIGYLFVRLFAFAALKATHLAVKAGIWTGGDRLAGASDKLDVMWTAPTYDTFYGPVNTAAMGPLENLGAWCLWFWVHLVIALVIAFLVSYLASSTTVIYYLLRRHVDATDLDDVYVEEAGEEGFEAEAAPPEGEGESEAETPQEGDQD